MGGAGSCAPRRARRGAEGQGQLGVTRCAEAFPQVHAAGDAVRVELDLAMPDGGGGFCEQRQRQHLAGKLVAGGGLGQRQDDASIDPASTGREPIRALRRRAGGIEQYVENDGPRPRVTAIVDECGVCVVTRASGRCSLRLASSIEMITTSSLAGCVQVDSTPS
jgi:hypothetical protein